MTDFMRDQRPNPDDLLARVKAEEAGLTQGSLKLFFGYAAGVGKTYAMLENARRARANGLDVVVGYVEPHNRPETEALLEGFEIIPVRELEYRGIALREFDIDAALERRPGLLLVDELAHTNAPGSRHEKRWQDVEELLKAGIHVWSTLNVQHIESLNDVIGQITGVVVRETLPDRVFDLAESLELVDLTPEELVVRLNEGKVYVTEQARQAIQSFFQTANLTALRELALRQAASRIHRQVETDRRNQAVRQPWATAERLLVCVGPSPTTARVIRTAKRMASAFDAPWLAVSVDLTGVPTSSPTSQQLAQHFRLAERLGAETMTLAGQDVTDTILEYARSRNVTKILIGKTNASRWHRLLFGSVVDNLLERSGEIDVYVIRGEEESRERATTPPGRPAWSVRPYLKAIGLIALTGCLAYGLKRLHLTDAEANTVMLFLAAVAYAAFQYGRGPAIVSSILAVLSFDFFFIPPLHTFAIADAQYVVTFGVMLAIALVISSLTARLHAQVERARERERQTSALHELGKQLSSLYGKVFLVGAAGSKIAEMVDGEVAIYLRQPSALPELAFGQDSTIAKHPVSLPAAQWVIEQDQVAGAGTNTLPNANAFFFPLTGSQRTQGAIAVRLPEHEHRLTPERKRFLQSCGNQLALALERDQLAIDASEARIKAEAEQVRNTLLSSVSHDLKTPLAAIAGASSSLLEADSIDEETRRQLIETVADEAARLHRLLENILQMSRLDAHAATPNKQWHVLEEIVGSALRRVRRELEDHEVVVRLPADLPLLHVDGLLLEQVFVNLLENAARYTPSGSTVAIRAALDGRSLRMTVTDNGPGLPLGVEEQIFAKFFRASPVADGGRGSGLGLAICRAILDLHGGTIVASTRPGGGAEFVIRLPLPGKSPRVTVEQDQ